jgi:hypothetical protein
MAESAARTSFAVFTMQIADEEVKDNTALIRPVHQSIKIESKKSNMFFYEVS